MVHVPPEALSAAPALAPQKAVAPPNFFLETGDPELHRLLPRRVSQLRVLKLELPAAILNFSTSLATTALSSLRNLTRGRGFPSSPLSAGTSRLSVSFPSADSHLPEQPALRASSSQ